IFEDSTAINVEMVAVINDIGSTIGDIEAATAIDDIGSTFNIEVTAAIDDIDDVGLFVAVVVSDIIGVFDLVGIASFNNVSIGAFDNVGIGAFDNEFLSLSSTFLFFTPVSIAHFSVFVLA
ncbi:46419_t:CDS:2, partial [Gigaspora margarita]